MSVALQSAHTLRHFHIVKPHLPARSASFLSLAAFFALMAAFCHVPFTKCGLRASAPSFASRAAAIQR